ncbi:MAG: energy transducer TonB, partial [Verrucomicrobiota bacterium]
SEPPPPPPKTPPLPKLDIQINSPAPPIKATTDPNIRPSVMMANFSNDQPQERKRMIFTLNDLDDQPRLLNRPRISFPESLRRRGVTEGRVCLEVEIHPNGRVDVLRVIECSDPEFASIATNFATRARFSPPKKDGRPVAAKFQWPIVLR